MLNLNKSVINSTSVVSLYTATRLVASKAEPSKTFHDLPGPKIMPVIGSFASLKGFGGNLDISDFRKFQVQIQKQYGDIVKFKLNRGNEVFLFDPKLTKLVYKHDGNIPLRSSLEPLNTIQQQLDIKLSLVTSNDERWRKLRSATNPVVARPQAIYNFLPKQNAIAQEFTDILVEKCNGKELILNGFEKNLRLLGYEFIGQIAFDKRFNCLDESKCDQRSIEFVNAVNDFLIYLGKLVFGLPVFKYYATEDWKIFEKNAKFVYSEALRKIEEADKNLDSSTETTLSHLLRRKEQYNLELKDIVAIMTDLIIGGVDTTSTALYFILYELGINQDIQEKLYQEIKHYVENGEEITADTLQDLRFLKDIVKETLRLHPLAPGNSRILSQDLELSGYLIKKGTIITFGTIFMVHSERYFKNPLKFDPERWERQRQGLEEIDPFTILSFGFGARMCIGRRAAEQEMYLTLIKLLLNFKVEYIGNNPGYKVGLILTPIEPLKIKLIKRN